MCNKAYRYHATSISIQSTKLLRENSVGSTGSVRLKYPINYTLYQKVECRI